MRQREIDSILKKINKFRVATGLEPLEDLLPGKPNTARACPIARSLNHNCAVTRTAITFNDITHVEAAKKVLGVHTSIEQHYGRAFWVTIPPLFRRFINEFDQQSTKSVRKYKYIRSR